MSLLQKNQQYNCSIIMNFTYFPVREFTEALEQTSKVKARLEPFIGEIESYNMQWTFQIFSELYKYTHAVGIEVSYKFNALVAIKVLLNTCEFPVLLCTEVYFLPHIRKVATFQIHLPEKQRGLTYFTNLGYSATQQNKKYGYNYVRLASEIISLMSRVKPWRLYRDEQVSQPSQFASSLDILKAYQWKEYQVFVFYSSEDEQRLRNRFIHKLQNFPLRSHKYYQFFQCYLDRVIRKEYSPKGIDPRKILQSCQIWACQMVLQRLKQILKQRRASVKANVIKMITDFIRWGYIKAYYIVEQEDIFGELLGMIRNAYILNNSHRKGYAFRELQGSQQQRKNLHKQLIRCLQIWAVCIPKNPVNLTQQSRSSAIYKQFLVQLKISVPEGSNFKKLRDQCQSNLQKNKLINHRIMKQMQLNFDASKLRRTSSNLQQLFNIDPNFLSLSTFKSYITSQFLSHNFSQNQSSFSDSEEDNNTDSSAKSQVPCIFEDIKEKAIFLAPPHSSMANKLSSTKQISLRRKKFQQENYCGEIDEHVETKKIIKPYFKMHKNISTTTKTKESKMPNQPKVQFFETTSFDFDSHTSIIFKQTQSNDSINIHISSPIKRNSSSKQQSAIESTIFESHIKKLLKRNAQLQQALLLKDIQIQILRAKQRVRSQSTNTSWNATNSAPIYRQNPFIPCREEFFKQYIWGVKQLSLRNIFQNKGLLIKTETIQIGFVIESSGDGSAKLQLYITPQYLLKNIHLQIKDPSNILMQVKKDILQQIPRLKQRKLSFKCKVNHFPYYLPKLYLKYNIDKIDQQHYLSLPLTPNRFISFKSHLKTMNPSVRFQTRQLTAKYTDTNKILSLFPQLKQVNTTDKINTLAGSVQIFDNNYNIYIKIDKSKIYLQGQYEVNKQYKERRQQLQFLLVSLLQILTK